MAPKTSSRFPGLAIGPESVDSAGDLVGELGVHNQADLLLQRHANLYPASLRLSLSAPVDRERSAAVDLEEVEEALGDLEGRRAFFREGYVLEDAAVHGDRPDNRVISVVFRVPPRNGRAVEHGRSGRGVIPYDMLPAIERRFEENQAQEARKRLGEVPAQTSAASADTRDKAVEERLQQLEREFRQAEEGRRAAMEELDKLKDPEPFEGYGEQNGDAIIARVKDAGRDEFGKTGLTRMYDYEARHADRKTVKEAIDRELAKPAPGE